jgi:hypothetical protein
MAEMIGSIGFVVIEQVRRVGRGRTGKSRGACQVPHHAFSFSFAPADGGRFAAVSLCVCAPQLKRDMHKLRMDVKFLIEELDVARRRETSRIAEDRAANKCTASLLVDSSSGRSGAS